MACGMCNSRTYKDEHFPVQDNDDNKPLLLNPCDDDPNQHIRFEQARVVPLSERGHTTRELLGLNREALFDQRRKLLHHIDYIRRSVEDQEKSGNAMLAQPGRELLNVATSTEAEYAAMVRQFMVEPLPSHLPL